MSGEDAKFWIAIITAAMSLIVVIINYFSTRANQENLERLREEINERQSRHDALLDYEYEAKKRLYHECGPLLFQLTELSESALKSIQTLATLASEGKLEPGPKSYLKDNYYRLSVMHRLLAPLAMVKLIQRRLTHVDLSLDIGIYRQYTLARQAYFSFADEFGFAKSKPELPYEPFDDEVEKKAISKPEIYWRQGAPRGVIDGAVESMIFKDDDTGLRVMTYAECESEYNKTKSSVRKNFDEISYLFEDFHPRTRPILWRMLITEACLYHALSRTQALHEHSWNTDQLIKSTESFHEWADWRQPKERSQDPTMIAVPIEVAKKYLQDKLKSKLGQPNNSFSPTPR